jgi:hypothetical protein
MSWLSGIILSSHASEGRRPVQFEIRESSRSLWSWVLLNETSETVIESRRSFPSRAQATAAALAFSLLVARAGRTLSGGPRQSGFL